MSDNKGVCGEDLDKYYDGLFPPSFVLFNI